MQATGRDARGRKQYRYHARWTAVRDAQKYHQLLAFAEALPRIRRKVARDMNIPELCQDKISAVLIRLLEITLIRIGTREYAKVNKSYGLTTLKRRHTTIAGNRIRFQFVGKSGVPHDVTVVDARIARVVKRCLDIPGQQLFHYRDESGEARVVDSGMVNAYLKEACGQEFTAKHYRTWAASVLAYAALRRRISSDEAHARRALVEVVEQVARQLSNTPAVCRACYIHPAITEAYLRGKLQTAPAAARPRGLSADERRLLAFLQQQVDAPA